MTLKTTITAALAATLAIGSIAAPAFAAPSPDTKPTREQRAMQMIERLDANKDSKVSLDEMQAKIATVFKTYDADGNGEVTRDEIKVKVDAFRDARKAMKEARGKGGPTEEQAMEKLREARADMLPGARKKMFKRIDADSNGMLSATEVASAAEKMFKRRDKNGDGFIDAADFTKKI